MIVYFGDTEPKVNGSSSVGRASDFSRIAMSRRFVPNGVCRIGSVGRCSSIIAARVQSLRLRDTNRLLECAATCR